VTLSDGRAQRNQRGMISPAEAIILAAMTAIVVAIAVPSYTAMQDRSHDATARATVRQAADAVEAFRSDRGSYAGLAQPSLRRYDPGLSPSAYELLRSGSKGYCVQSSSGGRTWHVEGPAGDVEHGSCP